MTKIYHANLYSSSKIQVLSKADLENRSIQELDIMIQTIEYETQRFSSSKGIFLSTVSIVIALVIVIVGEGIASFVLLALYSVMFLIFSFVSSNALYKLYKCINDLRYIRDNKK